MRRCLAGFLGALSGVFVLAFAMGLTRVWVLSAGAALGTAALVGLAVYRSRWLRLDPETCPPALRAISLAAMVVGIVQLARLTVFIFDPSLTANSFMPISRWEVHHACTTAYFVAARAAGTVDVYSDSLYTAPDDDPTKIRKPKTLGAFNIDVYEYPPPFLLLPRALLPLAPEFPDFRILWFGVCSATLLIAMVVTTRLLDPGAGSRALVLLPLFWVAIPTLSLMQKGNVQGFVIAISMLAMALFHRGRWAAGGALLAFATLSKLFPGMLAVYLLVHRRWKALAWTGAFSAVFLVWSLLAFGGEMYRSFAEHLPRLLSGEAFPAFRNPSALAMNFSIPAFVFKLRSFGVTGIDFSLSRVLGWVYTLAAVAVTFFVAKRAHRDRPAPMAWLSILILGTLRSPFIPQAYAAVPPLWLLTLLAARGSALPSALVGTLVGWAALNVYIPHDLGVDPRVMVLWSLVPFTATALVVVQGLRPDRPVTGAPDPMLSFR